MEELRQEDARRWRAAMGRSLWRVPWAALVIAGPVAALEVLTSGSVRTVAWLGPIVVLVLLDYVLAVRRREARTRFRDGRWAALWTAVDGRARDLGGLVRSLPRAGRPEADRMRVDAEVIAKELHVALRRADLAAAELEKMPAPYLPPPPTGTDSRDAELYRVASEGMARVAAAQEGLVSRVRRGETRAAAYATTLDLWRMRVLQAKGVAGAARLHELAEATAEARRALATVAAEGTVAAGGTGVIPSPARVFPSESTTVEPETTDVEVRRL